jgi:hypothetical protein
MNARTWHVMPIVMSSDEHREYLIRGVKERLIAASESGAPEQDRRDLFNAMRALIRGRSRAAVERIERARGLR